MKAPWAKKYIIDPANVLYPIAPFKDALLWYLAGEVLTIPVALQIAGYTFITVRTCQWLWKLVKVKPVDLLRPLNRN